MTSSRSKLRLAVLLPLLVLLMAFPGLTFAASFFGPIVPNSCHCDSQTVQGATSGVNTVTSAPDYGCVLLVIQNLVNFAVSLGVILCVLWIAYAGFSLMVSGGSPEARSTGKARLVNALVGIVVILTSWLIVNFIMGVLYNGSFGDWNGILAGSGDDTCIQSRNPVPITDSIVDTLFTSQPGVSSVPLSSAGTGACNPSVVQQGAAAGGYNLTNQQANQLACIAQPESNCGTKNKNYSWNIATSNGKASTAAGPYQVTIASHSACYQNPACTAAAGGQSLNCKQAFNSHGFVINQSLADQCALMAGNTACSASAAACAMGKGETFTSMYATDKSVGQCASGG